MENKKINMRNMPCGQLFEFAEGQYVWKIIRTNGTREGNYYWDTNLLCYTEVFRQENDGGLGIVWSGRLTTNPGVYNEDCLDRNGCFSIFSYDQDTHADFHQDFDLKVAPMKMQVEALESEINILKNKMENQKGPKL